MSCTLMKEAGKCWDKAFAGCRSTGWVPCEIMPCTKPVEVYPLSFAQRHEIYKRNWDVVPHNLQASLETCDTRSCSVMGGNAFRYWKKCACGA